MIALTANPHSFVGEVSNGRLCYLIRFVESGRETLKSSLSFSCKGKHEALLEVLRLVPQTEQILSQLIP